jgi:N-acetylglucosamine-6-phosphate deacetylase
VSTMRRLGVAAAVVDGVLVPGDIGVLDGAVAAVGLPGAGSGLAVPGLVDLQVNGYAGVDFLSAPADGWHQAGRALARGGVTAYVANLITCAAPVLRTALETAGEVARSTPPGTARLLGAHLEGPYLSPQRAGAHPVEHLRPPSVHEVTGWLDSGPVVGLTLAPELAGALEVVAFLRARGVLVALGHSEATAAEAQAGFDAGAATVTHVFNAMSTPTARDPGLAGVALSRPDVAVQLICDGVHLAAETASLVLAAARSRFVLVTDALSAAAAGDGPHPMGGAEVTVSGGRATRPDGTLAGSVASLAGCLSRAVQLGASVEDAVAAATTRPAALVGLDLGRLRPGDPADLVVLDDALTVRSTLLAGLEVG